MTATKRTTLPLAERQRLLDWLYRERLFRPVTDTPATRRPRAEVGKGSGAS